MFEVHVKEYFLGRPEVQAAQSLVSWDGCTDLYLVLVTTPSLNFLPTKIQTIDCTVQIGYFCVGEMLNRIGCWNAKHDLEANESSGHCSDNPLVILGPPVK